MDFFMTHQISKRLSHLRKFEVVNSFLTHSNYGSLAFLDISHACIASRLIRR